jgi:hypothetical protein
LWNGAIVVAYSDDFLDPGGHKWDTYDAETAQRPILALPFLVIEDCLQAPTTWHLKYHGNEQQQGSCTEVVMECVNTAAVNQKNTQQAGRQGSVFESVAGRCALGCVMYRMSN